MSILIGTLWNPNNKIELWKNGQFTTCNVEKKGEWIYMNDILCLFFPNKTLYLKTFPNCFKNVASNTIWITDKKIEFNKVQVSYSHPSKWIVLIITCFKNIRRNFCF